MKLKKLIFRISLTAIMMAALILVSPSFIETAAVSASEMIAFPDVKDDDWFASDVRTLVEAGVINGYPDGTFRPDRDIATSEFIKILIAVDGGLEAEHEGEKLFDGHWASEYITAAYRRGIISDADLEAGFDPEAPITRSAMTKMMVLALGIETSRIDDPFTDISDKYASTAYNEYLLRGYIQPDGSRIYKGSEKAMRSEAAAIAVRVMRYREDSYEYKKNSILENASANILTSENELIDLFYILNREFISEFVFRTNIPKQMAICYERSNVINIEYFYSFSPVYLTSLGDDTYRLNITFSPDIETVKKYHTDALERADKIISTILTEDMSEHDKVKAIHDYIILNCRYDYDNYVLGEIDFEARLAYGVLVNKNAVCQGYCAAFALLCERAGIRSIVISGNAPNSAESHAWNMVLIDGEILHIDVTHDDPVPDRKGGVSYRYFCLSEIEMVSHGYVWDKSISNLKFFY